MEDAEDEREKNWGRPKYRQPGHVDNVSHEQKLGGCLASDTGEHIWRPMESPPVNLGREIMGVEMSVSSAFLPSSAKPQLQPQLAAAAQAG